MRLWQQLPARTPAIVSKVFKVSIPFYSLQTFSAHYGSAVYITFYMHACITQVRVICYMLHITCHCSTNDDQDLLSLIEVPGHNKIFSQHWLNQISAWFLPNIFRIYFIIDIKRISTGKRKKEWFHFKMNLKHENGWKGIGNGNLCRKGIGIGNNRQGITFGIRLRKRKWT